MAICNRCGKRYRMNWVRMQPCPDCRKKPAGNFELAPTEQQTYSINGQPATREEVKAKILAVFGIYKL